MSPTEIEGLKAKLADPGDWQTCWNQNEMRWSGIWDLGPVAVGQLKNDPGSLNCHLLWPKTGWSGLTVLISHRPRVLCPVCVFWPFPSLMIGWWPPHFWHNLQHFPVNGLDPFLDSRGHIYLSQFKKKKRKGNRFNVEHSQDRSLPLISSESSALAGHNVPPVYFITTASNFSGRPAYSSFPSRLSLRRGDDCSDRNGKGLDQKWKREYSTHTERNCPRRPQLGFLSRR